MSENNTQIEKIPIHLIDEPEHAMRSDVWDDDLNALAESIKQFGLLQPATLRKKGERYEIIAGHRRFSAFKKLGYSNLPSIIREADDVTSDAMKVHENLYRADVNPVDQAIFLGEYMERSNLNLAELAEQLNRTTEWVKSRIDILAYPEYLMIFVGEGKLSMATAAILNQIESPHLREKYCRDAAIIGLSATRAKYWLSQAKVAAGDPNRVSIVEPPEGAPATERPVLKFRCELDEQEYPAEDMTMVYVHPKNLRDYKELLSNYKDIDTPTPPRPNISSADHVDTLSA